jgi:3-oxoadipate enol-lactonase
MVTPRVASGQVSWADNGGVEIAYQVLGGSGQFLVLVHGLGYGRLGWGPFAPLLSGGRRVVLVDNRGVGESGTPPGPYRVSEMATDIVAVLDDLGLERADVVGASLGGMITLELAATYPERLRRMVLIATTPGPPQGTPFPSGTAALLAGRVRADGGSTRRLVEGALSPATVAARPGMVEDLLALRQAQAQPASAWRAQAAASASFSLGMPLGELGTPALAVAGLDDAVIDPANTMRLSLGLGRARGFFVSPAGHLCFWEEPELLASVVADFLDADFLDAEVPVEVAEP